MEQKYLEAEILQSWANQYTNNKSNLKKWVIYTKMLKNIQSTPNFNEEF